MTQTTIRAERERLKKTQPAFYAELLKQGFKPRIHTDTKTGKRFIGWSIQ